MNQALTSVLALAFAAGLSVAAEAQPATGPTTTTRDSTNPATPAPTDPTNPSTNTNAPNAGDTIAPGPAGPPTTPQPAAGTTPLADVPNARTVLMNAKVKDNKGEMVGEVKRVTLGPDGKIASLAVHTGARTVTLKADGLMFAQADKTIQSTQSKDEIQKLPPA